MSWAAEEEDHMRRLLVLTGIVSLLVLVPMAVIAQDSTPEAQPEATAEDVTRTIPAYVFPYNSDGLNAELTVTANVSGVCGSESLETPGRPDAWDCLGEDNQVYDPCFENPFAATSSADAPGEVACMTSPFVDEVVLLTLNAPLDRDKEVPGNEAESRNLPWGLELAGGEQCLLLANIEVVLAGEAVHYDCTNGGTILGVVDRSQPLWTVIYLADGEMVTTLADVAVAWS
jgi:hypothetical protein